MKNYFANLKNTSWKDATSLIRIWPPSKPDAPAIVRFFSFVARWFGVFSFCVGIAGVIGAIEAGVAFPQAIVNVFSGFSLVVFANGVQRLTKWAYYLWLVLAVLLTPKLVTSFQTILDSQNDSPGLAVITFWVAAITIALFLQVLFHHRKLLKADILRIPAISIITISMLVAGFAAVLDSSKEPLKDGMKIYQQDDRKSLNELINGDPEHELPREDGNTKTPTNSQSGASKGATANKNTQDDIFEFMCSKERHRNTATCRRYRNNPEMYEE